MKKGRLIGCLIFSLVIFVFGIFLIPKLFNKINYGLDLQGGFEVLYEVSPLEGDKLDSDMLYSTYKSILKRIDILGVSEPEITIEGDNRIRVKLAGVKDIDSARNIISSTATLSFRDYYDHLLMTSDVLGGSAKVSKDNMGRPAVLLNIKDTSKFYDVTNKVKDMEHNIIVIWLDYQTGDKYKNEELTCGNMNSRCLSAASVREAFASDVIISGNFTKKEVKSLVELINSGALPTKLTELSSRTVPASFGETALNKTLIAGAIGLSLVILLMIIVYRFSGFLASIGLIIYTVFSLLIFYLIDGVLTLPGIAAMLLGVGMAIDSSIVSFERIKENLKIGKNLNEAYVLGNKNSFTSIIDSNITTLIAAIILFVFGESSVKGFATMLIINIIAIILIMVYIVRLLMKLFVKNSYFNNKLNLFIGVKKDKIKKSKDIEIPYKKLNFSKYSFKFMLMSLVLIVVLSIISFVVKPNLGVDFTGGTSVNIEYSENIDASKLFSDYSVKSISKSSNNINIILKDTLSKEEISELSNKINEEYGVNSDISVVSKVVKVELTKNAILSLIYAMIGIIIYVAIRFRFNYAISAIVALLHDVIITFLLFTVFRIEINSIFIASILTIIGYSINDTIVTFDMVRDNYKNKYKNNITNSELLKELLNISIRRCLNRTILTTITTIIPVIMMILFGAFEIFEFNIALLIGFIAGTYSSIFISNMIWYYLEKHRIMKPKREDDDELSELKVRGINC